MQALVKIKRISKKRGLSLYQLNNQAGLKANVIYSWKTKNPSVEKLKAFFKHVRKSTLCIEYNFQLMYPLIYRRNLL